MNKYTLAYTVYHTTDKSFKPLHKKYEFESEADLIGAADDGMCAIFDRYEKDQPTAVLFRSVTLDNAKEVYEALKPMNGDKDE